MPGGGSRTSRRRKEVRETELKEKILGLCDREIKRMENADCPQEIKENAIRRRQATKKIVETVCGIQGITPDTAIRILNEAQRIIKEVVMNQKI